MIRFERFGWRFASAETWALREISLCIDRGEFVTIAGPSGSGKSTLAQAACGLLIGRQAGDVEGNVHVGGCNVAAAPLHETAQTIGLVQQNPETHFATLTVSDEIAFGMENRCLPRDEIRRHSDEAMALLSINHLRGRSLATLSGGEKQRVTVASIVAGRPDVLVLDEPTASLDPEASRDLFRTLAELCRRTGLTVVIIEHKLAHLAPLKPRLIVLEAGRIVSDTPSGSAGDAHAIAVPGGPVTVLQDQGTTGSTSGPGDPLITMSDVTVELNGRPVLEDVSLRVRAGEVVALLGPNGGGKTTLLHALAGLTPIVCGSIRVCDMDVSRSVVSRLAAQVGLVFQNADHQLVADSVWHEALFTVRHLGIPAETPDLEADRLLEQAGLSERKEDHPFRLSWGQKRRLNLISAVLHKPRLLLLDEPFAGQDWENVAFLLEVIRCMLNESPEQPRTADTRVESIAGAANCRAVQQHGVCLMVTHDPRIVLRSCTRLLFIREGGVTVDAPVPEAFDQLREMGHDAYVPANGS